MCSYLASLCATGHTVPILRTSLLVGVERHITAQNVVSRWKI